MLPWFLRDPQRLDRERRAVEDLAARARWLIGHEWLIERDTLCIAATIRVGQRDFNLKLIYPTAFPYAPPIVRPVGEDARLSEHQYGGADGPLCLEWGPDNWHPDVTAAHLLTSSHDLLATESAEVAGEMPRIAAPSRHSLTQGQELRSAIVRWYLNDELSPFLTGFPLGAEGQFECSLRGSGDSWVCLVHAVTGPGGVEWRDGTIPGDIPGATPRPGKWVRSNASTDQIRNANTLDALETLLGTQSQSSEDDPRAMLVLDVDLELHLVVVVSDGGLIPCRAVRSAPDPEISRAPDSRLLQSNRVAVVGLGSAGSKIAVTLARMGANDLYLVDHDVFLPENLHRHALDWQGVGCHKVDATAQAVRLINAGVQVQVERCHLTGQESTAYLNSVLQRLSKCQLVVDATGDASAFNLLSGICGAAGVTLVWVEVFGGGIGGLFGRSRPGVDGRPQDIRAAFLSFCEAHPAPPELARATDYSILAGASQPLTASDADVAILAHFAARMAVDSLKPVANMDFAESLYLVGLSPLWIFDEAPTVVPLYTRTLPKAEVPTEVDEQMSADTVNFLLKLLEKNEET